MLPLPPPPRASLRSRFHLTGSPRKRFDGRFTQEYHGLRHTPRHLHVRHDSLAKLAAFEQFGAGHEAVEVVRDCSSCRGGGVHTTAKRAAHGSCRTSNGAVHALDHEVCGLVPPQVSQHDLAGKNHGTGVNLQQRQRGQTCAAPPATSFTPTLSNIAYFGAVPCVASKMACPLQSGAVTAPASRRNSAMQHT